MAKGLYSAFDSGTLEGVIDVNSSLGPWRLRSSNPETKSSVVIEGRPERVYLLVDAEVPERLSPAWRIILNDLSLTKVFRPNVVVGDLGVEHALTVYDVTPIVRQGKNELKVTYKGEIPVVVNGVITVALYRAEKFSTTFSLEAGELVMDPGEERIEQCEGSCIAFLKTSVTAKAVVESDNLRRVVPPETVEELSFSKRLSVRNESQKGSVKLFALFRSKTVEPRIAVAGERTSGGIVIAYEGDVRLNKLIVNVLKNGVSVVYKVFEGVSPGDRVTLPVQDLESGSLVRAVAVIAGYRKVMDFKV
jgi:hypothetical protein